MCVGLEKPIIAVFAQKTALRPNISLFQILQSFHIPTQSPFQHCSQVGLEKVVMTCGHGDKLGNSVCDFLLWFNSLYSFWVEASSAHGNTLLEKS